MAKMRNDFFFPLTSRKERNTGAAAKKTTSFPGSLIFPFRLCAPGDWKMRGPGNEVEKNHVHSNW